MNIEDIWEINKKFVTDNRISVGDLVEIKQKICKVESIHPKYFWISDKESMLYIPDISAVYRQERTYRHVPYNWRKALDFKSIMKEMYEVTHT